jgi:competence protein ComEC
MIDNAVRSAYTELMLVYTRQSLHISWHIAVACVALFIGVLIAKYLPLSLFGSIAWLLTGVAFFSFAALRSTISALIFSVLAGLLIGLWRGSTEQVNLASYEEYIGKSVGVVGTIVEDVDVNKRDQSVLRLKNVSINNSDLSGNMWVTVPKDASLQRSDKVKVDGKVVAGFGSFAASMHSAQLIESAPPSHPDIALELRNWFADGVKKAISEPEVSLGLGYLLGQRRGLPEELDTALKVAGLTHVVVASGYNLTILVRLARRLFENISKYLSFVFSGGMIVSFIAVTGMSPSMSRAGLVTGLSLLAWYYGRKFHPIILLSIAIGVTVLLRPSYAWGDVGWQLSFAAFAGVMILAPLLQRYYFGDTKPGMVRQIFGETFSAWLCTLPILMYSFGVISNVAIVANLLILPLVPLAMLLTFIAGIGGLLVPSFANIVGLPAEMLLSYMTQTAQYIANIPWAQSEITLQIWQVIGMYILLILACFYMQYKTHMSLRESNIVE